MKVSAHSIHPDVAKAVTVLCKSLVVAYPSGDSAFTLTVEGQIVAATGGKEDVTPAVWDDVAAETAKRAVKKPEPKEPETRDFGE